MTDDPLSRRQRAGLGLSVLLAVADNVTINIAPPEGKDAPPHEVVVLEGVLGAVTVVVAALAWRTGAPRQLRLVAGVRLLSLLASLPTFFVDVPAGAKVQVAVGVLLTLVTVVLVLTPDRVRAPVTD